MKYTYTGLENNKQVVGTIEAETEIIARVRLRRSGISPRELKQSNFSSFFQKLNRSIGGESKNKEIVDLAAKFGESISTVHDNYYPQSTTKSKTKVRVKEKDVFAFIRQFAIVIKSGVPLLRAFDIVIGGQENKGFAMILTDIRFGIQNGLSLSEAFGSYPQIFDKLFLNFLSIGEDGGILDVLLERYIIYSEKVNVIKRKVKSSLTYPTIVLFVAFLVVGVVLGFVVPQFQKIFADFGATLPWPTLLVIKISDIIVNYWYMLIAAFVIIALILRTIYRSKPEVHFKVDSFITKIPLIKHLIIKSTVSKFARTLSLLFSAGVPLNSALSSVGFMTENYVYACSILNMRKQIESGSSLSFAVKDSGIYPAMLVQMIAVGEESGTLDYLLTTIADYYDAEVEMVIESLLALIEPLTITFLGIVLGSIIIAIYLPLFNLGNVVS